MRIGPGLLPAQPRPGEHFRLFAEPVQFHHDPLAAQGNGLPGDRGKLACDDGIEIIVLIGEKFHEEGIPRDVAAHVLLGPKPELVGQRQDPEVQDSRESGLAGNEQPREQAVPG